MRWEYESPLTEEFGRLVNLDTTSGFADVAPVVASDPVGSLTGTHYPASLVRADPSNAQPRLGLAWRPLGGSSLVIRAGYGVYPTPTSTVDRWRWLNSRRSKAVNAENSAETPLTLANGFIESASARPTPWRRSVCASARAELQISAQRDLPAAHRHATYLGAAGNRLMVEVLPFCRLAASACPTCPLVRTFVKWRSLGTRVSCSTPARETG